MKSARRSKYSRLCPEKPLQAWKICVAMASVQDPGSQVLWGGHVGQCLEWLVRGILRVEGDLLGIIAEHCLPHVQVLRPRPAHLAPGMPHPKCSPGENMVPESVTSSF